MPRGACLADAMNQGLAPMNIQEGLGLATQIDQDYDLGLSLDLTSPLLSRERNINEEEAMTDVDGAQGWRLHPFVNLPLHRNRCQVCQAYIDHVIGMETESADWLVESMARVWGKQGDGELRDENKRLKEECQEARRTIEKLKREAEESRREAAREVQRVKEQAEEPRRSAERKIEQLEGQVDESKRELEREIERLKKEVEESKHGIGNLRRAMEELKRSGESRKARSPVASVSACVCERRNRRSSPGPTESDSVPGSASDVVISQMCPVPIPRIGRADIVGFGLNGVTVLRNTHSQPRIAKLEVPDFGSDAGGWQVNEHVRLVGDTTGDGLGDIIGFGDSGVYVARNNGTSFSPSSRVLEDFCSTTGWSARKHVRYIADLRAKGYVDIIGFGEEGVFVSLNHGDGTFAPPRLVSSQYGFSRGWRPEEHAIFLTDVNGNGLLDIVAFGDTNVSVSLGKGDGSFGPGRSGLVYDRSLGFYPRSLILADLTGDGKPDIIAFDSNGQAHTALSNSDGIFRKPIPGLPQAFFYYRTRNENNLETVADINGNGLGDIVIFDEEGVLVAIGNGDGTFQHPVYVIKDFGSKAGWRVDKYPRFAVDLTGNGAADIIGFGSDAVWVSYNNGMGRFGPIQKLTEEFSANRGWSMDKTIRLIANLG